jgi:antitoxin MazE
MVILLDCFFVIIYNYCIMTIVVEEVFMVEQIKIPIVPIGSSKGFRISKKILDRLGMKDSAIATINDDSITLRASVAPREGWEADFKRCHELGEDKLLIPDDLDADQWKDL